MDGQNYSAFWEEALVQIREEYRQNGQESEFTLWYSMKYVSDDQNKILVEVPSEFMWSQMVERGHVQKVEEKIQELSGQTVSIEYVLKPKKTAGKPEFPRPEADEPLHNPRKNLSPQKSRADEEPKEEKKHPQLNEDYTFESFVSGDNNAFAYNASLAISKNPGITYNPLLLYGGVGLGKTHLMQAVGNYIWKSSSKNINICYISTENLMNEFTSSLVGKKMEKFKDKYRKLDVLLLDDIQFLENKDGLQQELFYTFESLFNSKKQMVFTCDRPITDIKGIEKRLSSRFTRGMSVDMKAPDYETRKAILQKKLSLMGKIIPDEITDLIAKNVQTNVRDLESALNKMIGYSELIKKELTLDIAKDLLSDTFSQVTAGAITIETIQKVVADHYNISVSDIRGKKRSKQFVVPRHIAIYLSRELTEFSFPDIGNEFGKDHTTAMHSHEKVAEQIKIDSSLNSTIQTLIRDIKEYKK